MYEGPELNHAFGLCHHGNYLFWTEYRSGSVYRLERGVGSVPPTVVLLRSERPPIFEIRMYDAQQQQGTTNGVELGWGWVLAWDLEPPPLGADETSFFGSSPTCFPSSPVPHLPALHFLTLLLPVPILLGSLSITPHSGHQQVPSKQWWLQQLVPGHSREPPVCLRGGPGVGHGWRHMLGYEGPGWEKENCHPRHTYSGN